MCLSDLPTQGSYLFVEPDYSGDEARRMSRSFTPQVYRQVLLSLRDRLAGLENAWSEANISDVVHTDMKQSGLKAKQYMTMLRHAITGAEVSFHHCSIDELLIVACHRRAQAWLQSCASSVTSGQPSDSKTPGQLLR